MKKEFIEPEVEIIEFEIKQNIAYTDQDGWIIHSDPDKEWQ